MSSRARYASRGLTCAQVMNTHTFTRVKTVAQVMADQHEVDPAAKTTLKRALTVVDLLGYGVGCTVGAGIYSLVGAGAKVAGKSHTEPHRGCDCP